MTPQVVTMLIVCSSYALATEMSYVHIVFVRCIILGALEMLYVILNSFIETMMQMREKTLKCTELLFL